MSSLTALELFKLLTDNPGSMVEVRVKVFKTVKVKDVIIHENVNIDGYEFVNADIAPNVPLTGKRGRPHNKYTKYIRDYAPKNKPFCVHRNFYNALIQLGYKTKNMKFVDDHIYVSQPVRRA